MLDSIFPIIFTLILIAVLIAVLVYIVRIVPQANAYVIERLGAYHSTVSYTHLTLPTIRLV